MTLIALIACAVALCLFAAIGVGVCLAALVAYLKSQTGPYAVIGAMDECQGAIRAMERGRG